MKDILYGKTLTELQAVCAELKMPGFTAKQIAQWLYQKDARSIEDMTNVSKKNRSLLEEKYEVGRKEPLQVQVSVDGTKKYLFEALGNNFIETAMIPDRDRKTVCVSSQVGCKMACVFCMTGKQGFQNQLTAGEILNQIFSIEEGQAITNIVYMGMGEPFDNIDEVLKSLTILTSEWGYAMSPRRITVSSIGIVPSLKRFLYESECHLAISMHTPFDEERRELMPIQKAYSIKEVVEEIKDFDFGLQRRVSFEYIMFKGVNDTQAHVKELARLIGGLRCRINLIRFHAIPDASLEGTDLARMEEFRDALNKKNIMATIRSSRGQDIFAACGLLSTKALLKRNEEIGMSN